MVILAPFVRLRRFLLPLATAGGLCGVVVAAPGGCRDIAELPALKDQVAQLERDRAEMEVMGVRIADRIARKEALLQDLLAGRQTLRAVAEAFEALNSDEVNAAIIRRAHPGATDLERNANNVMVYAELRVAHPSEREVVMARLEAQFRQEFGHDAAY